MKRKIWKKFAAAGMAAVMLLCTPSYTYAAELSADELFSSEPEADAGNIQEELFTSESDMPQNDIVDNVQIQDNAALANQEELTGESAPENSEETSQEV